MLNFTLRTALIVAIATLPAVAAAQTFRCVGTDGKKYYGQSVPAQCLGQPVEQLNSDGSVVRRFDAAASADERAKKEADEADRKKREAASKDQGRRDRALLATYTSENDVDDARRRALEENQRAIKEIEGKISGLKTRRATSKADTAGIDIDLKAQEGLLETKRKEVIAINARYDDDKKRYAEITKRGK